MSFLHTLSKGRFVASRAFAGALPARSFHMNAKETPVDIPQMFSDILTAEPNPPPDRVNTLLNMIYTHSPRSVTPFNLHCRTMRERWVVKGLRVGAKKWVHPAERGANVVLVSGLQPQDTSSVAVSLYVAAALSRSPLAADVSIVPVAYPKEYEKRWSIDQVRQQSYTLSEDASVPSEEYTAELDSIDTLRDVSEGPLKNYIARLGRYHVNTVLDLKSAGSMLTYKKSSLSKFNSNDNASLNNDLASHLFAGNDSLLLDPMMRAPTYVIQLKNTGPLDDEQIVYRADEVVKAIHELITSNNPQHTL
eukprot:TRINITY_DN24531_c0_g1_i1.p1 TRINITY_DN24531_c0_g1~~TRINITY_DN24531_c0_g1_i1.p1  ORF type:complete len:306 (+),score=33.73 TRINITY_DN24531_c0_g1_i1:138-1055(+)